MFRKAKKDLYDMDSFKIYTIDEGYLEQLKEIEPKVPCEHDDKNQRPFIGIIITSNNVRYIIPMTSPKEKHRHMRNAADFIKIADGELGALNLNNMIPVIDNSFFLLDMNNQDSHYRALLLKQLEWINQTENREIINRKSISLIEKHKSGKLKRNIRQRCCNFSLLEEIIETIDY